MRVKVKPTAHEEMGLMVAGIVSIRLYEPYCDGCDWVGEAFEVHHEAATSLGTHRRSKDHLVALTRRWNGQPK